MTNQNISPETNSIVLTNNECDKSDSLRIQINPSIANRMKEIGKKAVEDELPYLNCSKNWITKTVTIDSLAQLIGEGMTWRPSVKDKGISNTGNKKEDITSVDSICLDFDDGCSLEKTLSNPYTRYACLWYYTPSYKPGENERHRLVFRLPDNTSVEKAEEELEFLIDLYDNGNDRGACDAGRFFYGATKPEYVHVLNPEAVLPLSSFQWKLKSDPNSNTPERRELPSKASNNKRRSSLACFSNIPLDWFHLKLVVQKGLAVPDIYYLYPHNDLENKHLGHNFQRREPDEVGMIEKYEGCNPWKPSATGEGTSFCVNVYKNELPAFVDRTGIFKNVNTKTGQIKHGGSFIEYWYHMKNMTSGKWIGQPLHKVFNEVVHNICEDFKLEEFDFKSNKHKIEVLKYYLSEELKGKLYLCKWQGASGFFAFDSIAQIWRYENEKAGLWINIINPLIKARYGKDVAETASLQKILIDWVFHNWNEYFLLQPNFEDTRYAPFANGLYDTEYNVIIPNDGRAYNLSRFAFDYERVSDEDPDILEFTNYWFEWIGCPVKSEFLLNWIIMNAHRKAGTVANSIVCLIGKKQCGKTFFHKFINKMLGISYGKVPDQTFMSGTSNHSTAQLEGIYHIGLQELGQNMSAPLLKQLMELSGQTGQKTFSINPKGQSNRPALLQLGITADSENELRLPSTQEGIERRFNLISVPPTASREDLEPVRERLEANTQKILCWCIQQDFTQIKQRFIELSKHNEIAGYTRQVIAESDPIHTFIRDCLLVTNQDEDRESTKDLHIMYEIWARVQGIKIIAPRPKFKSLLPQCLHRHYSWYSNELQPPKEATHKMQGKPTLGFKGIKLDQESCDEYRQQLGSF